MALFRRSKPEQQRALPDPEAIEWASLQQMWPGQTRETPAQTFIWYALEGYAANPVVFSLVLARLQLLAQAEFKFQWLDTRRMFGSPELLVLEEPWQNGTSGDLIAQMEQHASIAGNAFVRRSSLTTLAMMRPDWTDIVSVVVDEGSDHEGRARTHREVIGYLFSEGGQGVGDPVFYDVADVAHWTPIPDPLSQSGRGMSWMTPILREINADTAMTKHRQSFFDNAATPNILLKYQGKLKPEQLESIKRRWQSRFSGRQGAGATVVLDEGADLTVVGSTFESMRFNDVQAAGEARMAGAAGVPPIVAGLQAGLDAATYANFEMAFKAFANSTCAYLWQSLCSALAKLVNVPAGSRLWFDTSLIPALQEAEKERAESMQVLASAASTLLTAGYTAESITNALVAGDLTQLKHTGMISVQLVPNDVQALKAQQQAVTQIDKAEQLPSPAATAAAGRSAMDDMPSFQPIVNVYNQQDPTPVTVNNTVEVEPTPIDVRVDAPVTVEATQVSVEPTPVDVHVAAPTVTVDAPVTVQPSPAQVTVMPSPATVRKVKRDVDGNITAIVEE